MYTLLKSLALGTCFLMAGPIDAQIFKKLKHKLDTKVEQKLDQTMDQAIDGVGKKSEKTSEESSLLTTYKFDVETKVKVSDVKEGSTYNLSYLLSNSKSYVGLKTNLAEYSEGEMTGESTIVMDGEDLHIFVNTPMMKVRMSQDMMDKQGQNPVEDMVNYDYSKIKKTGQTRTILGETCYEYRLADKDVVMSIWVAPAVKLPNWFVQNTALIDGHIMAYEMRSKDGHMTSETLAIDWNIDQSLNSKEYKKMF